MSLLLGRLAQALGIRSPTPLPTIPRGPLERMLLAREPDGRVPVYCQPLGDPTWVTLARDRRMRPQDAVLGLARHAGAWALPWWVMKNHHVANLTLRGRPTLVTLCEVCAGSRAFDPVIDGRRHTFRVEGAYNTKPILADFETESLWDPFRGLALHGPLTGARLGSHPLYQCTWQEWTTLYPMTLVADGTREPRDGHCAEFTDPAVQLSSDLVSLTQLREPDPRLPRFQLVLGVEADGRARAYPLARLHRLGPVLNDTLGGTEVVILTRPGSWLSVAFARRLDDRVLVFRPTDDPTRVEDVETGSCWDLTGTAVAGPLAGRALRFVPSGLEKWYAWVSNHADTEVYGLSS